jgi:hydrogenase large subunit
MARIVIDPVTRINGQMRIEAELSGGRVSDALSSGTLFRGIEPVLLRRDPRDVWMLAERICGTCSTVHALASVRAAENALSIAIPDNARLLRNIVAAAILVRDHVMSFYQAQLPDWVDLRSALAADPAATSTLAQRQSASWTSGKDHFQQVQDRLTAEVDAGRPGLFGPGWWGHPAYRLSPEQSLLLISHLVDALDWQANFMRIHALLGGKDPHPQTFLVGGMALVPPWGGPSPRANRGHPDVPERNSPDPLSDEGLNLVDQLLATAGVFVSQVLLPDVQLLASAYPEWAAIGAGPGNYLAYGEYPLDNSASPALFLPRGQLVAGNLELVQPIDQGNVAETVVHAWYQASEGETNGGFLPPASGETTPDFDASLPLSSLDAAGRYSWIKAARYAGVPMETGPLARVLISYAQGNQQIGAALGDMLRPLSLGLDAMPSVLGRLIAQSVEATVVAGAARDWLLGLRQHLASGDLAVADISSWDPGTWPSEAAGWSLGEGPRGAVGHWISIKDRVTDRYQVVDASTWNASPRDGNGQRGPIEAALAGVDVADAMQPLELLRVIHSFNPCVACASHVVRARPGMFDLRVSIQEAIE